MRKVFLYAEHITPYYPTLLRNNPVLAIIGLPVWLVCKAIVCPGRILLLIIIIIFASHCTYPEQEEPLPTCNLPSVQCSNGEYYNGTECPKKLTIIERFTCDSIVYKRR